MIVRLVMLAFGCLLWAEAGLVWAQTERNGARTWKTVAELSAQERERIDLSTDTPRHATFPYLPAELYPFTPPYTAEEMGFRSMEFPHQPRWSCVQIEDYGTVMPTGYLFTGKIITLAIHPYPEGLVSYFNTKPGDIYARWLS